MLIGALSSFEGTMLFVSHDRHFLEALSNRALELTSEGIHQYGMEVDRAGGALAACVRRAGWYCASPLALAAAL
jgi:ATPase subunit of ABC transporter with duplicated ATPase domains